MSSKKSRRQAKVVRQTKKQRKKKRRVRRAAYVSLAGAVLVFGAWLAMRPSVNSDHQIILVEANMSGFRPKVIRAKAGEPITLRLKSLDTPFHTDGGGKHQLAIDELGVDIITPPGRSRDATFTVSEPGVYRFYCSVCCGGKANPSMWGRLIVRA